MWQGKMGGQGNKCWACCNREREAQSCLREGLRWLPVAAVTVGVAAEPPYVLVQRGTSCCVVVRSDKVAAPERYAAAELQAYLGKLSADGFVLQAGPRGLFIAAPQPMGVLLGGALLLRNGSFEETVALACAAGERLALDEVWVSKAK